ncbi:MAG: HemK2/MTQ2 family protein methyltransferase [Promethearchaeota archaeon]
MEKYVKYEGIELAIPRGKGIYAPAEDTYLLLETINEFILENMETIRAVHDPVLEMGSGSGLISLVLARYFKHVHSVDVNYHSSQFLKQNRKANLKERFRLIDIVNADLVGHLRRPGISGALSGRRYFLACFNPPYLPFDDDLSTDGEILEGRVNDPINGALYSGSEGRAVLSRFLNEIVELMCPGGHVFFITSSLSHFDELDELLNSLKLSVVSTRKIHLFFEDIIAYHAIK